MAGHSKWANIRHKKGRQDKVRGKKFTQLIREITVAAQEGEPEIETNPRLRLAVQKAQQANMPKDTIIRAIQRGGGTQDQTAFESVRYEGYGPAGIAVMANCLTDNRNRTVGEVRHAFAQVGGNLGTDGSVAYLFDYQGCVTLKAGPDEETVMQWALGTDAQDVEVLSDGFWVTTAPEDFAKVRAALINEPECEVDEALMRWVPKVCIPVDDDVAEKVARLMQILEDLDDVQAVFSNVQWPD